MNNEEFNDKDAFEDMVNFNFTIRISLILN